MAWSAFPYADAEAAYRHTPVSLQAAWPRLHACDAEPWPADARLVDAWIACHAGQFELAAQLGLDAGFEGYAVAHRAICLHATYVETSERRRNAVFEEVAARCERQQAAQPDNPAGYHWHAYALARYAQGVSVVKALAQGVGGKVKASLDTALRLAPAHCDAHVTMGGYHAEIIDKLGVMAGALSYGASKDSAYRHFRTALALHPESAIARLQFANALLMLGGRGKLDEALALRAEAAACLPCEAGERLHVELAKQPWTQAGGASAIHHSSTRF